ncbi:MAG: hypothetical protein KF852_00185 [Saprospiraceae bacterium]|nr:hypothetical protein [Saprospiraceae bacterium]
MKTFKNLFSIATLALVAGFFTAPQQAQAQQTREHILLIKIQVEPQAAAYIKFDGVDGECQVKEGRNIVGRNTRTGEQLVVVVKDRKLAQFGTQAAGGAFKAIPANASPCFTIQCTTLNPPKCYTLPGGECICVCGPWISAAGGRN